MIIPHEYIFEETYRARITLVTGIILIDRCSMNVVERTGI
jgi:hypothetical protein